MASITGYQKGQQDRLFTIRYLAAACGAIREPLPATNPAPPTIAHGTSNTLTRVHPANLMMERAEGGIIRGYVGHWNSTNNRVDIDARPVTLDFWVTDLSVEVGWTEAVGGGTRIWTWVDGQPAEAAPAAAPTSTSNFTDYVTKLTWATRARRRVTMWFFNTNSIRELRTSSTGWIASTGRIPKVAVIGDSYIGGSNGSGPPNGVAEVMARALGVELLNEGIGGSGYGANTVYSDSTRVARVQAFQPDLIVFFGSINDSGASLQSQAAATYTAYAAACPTAVQIVIGVQPTGATATLSSTQAAAAKSVRDAAIAAGAGTNYGTVLAYFDPIGYATTGSVPTTINGSSFAVTAGALYSYQGSVWKGLTTGNTGPGTPGNSSLLELVTWGYSGTGNAGATDGTGTRDVLVYGGDNVHPTTEGAYFLGLATADAVVTALRTAVGASA